MQSQYAHDLTLFRNHMSKCKKVEYLVKLSVPEQAKTLKREAPLYAQAKAKKLTGFDL